MHWELLVEDGEMTLVGPSADGGAPVAITLPAPVWRDVAARLDELQRPAPAPGFIDG